MTDRLQSQFNMEGRTCKRWPEGPVRRGFKGTGIYESVKGIQYLNDGHLAKFDLNKFFSN